MNCFTRETLSTPHARTTSAGWPLLHTTYIHTHVTTIPFAIVRRTMRPVPPLSTPYYGDPKLVSLGCPPDWHSAFNRLVCALKLN